MRIGRSNRRQRAWMGEPFPVRRYNIDTNEHVNNCQYVQMAMEMLPGDINVHQLRVDYKKVCGAGRYDLPEGVGRGGADPWWNCAMRQGNRMRLWR